MLSGQRRARERQPVRSRKVRSCQRIGGAFFQRQPLSDLCPFGVAIVHLRLARSRGITAAFPAHRRGSFLARQPAGTRGGVQFVQSREKDGGIIN
jgi:hypothetical protein